MQIESEKGPEIIHQPTGRDGTHAHEEPPVTKYRYTLVVFGNSHEEITQELLGQTRGGYLMDSGYERRDEFRVIGGRRTSTLEHTNPDMTPERYPDELHEWAERRQFVRRIDGSGS